MSVDAPLLVGTGASAAGGTTLGVSVSTVPPIGALAIFFSRWQSTQTSSSISDGTGGVWTSVSAGNEIIGFSRISTDLTGATITATGQTSTRKIAAVWYFTGEDQWIYGGATASAIPFFQGTARNIGGNTVTPEMVGDLILGVWSIDGAESSFTAGSGYTVGPTMTGGGYYTDGTISIEGVYRSVASITTFQPLATGSASPVAYGAYSFVVRQARTIAPLVESSILRRN